MDGAAGGTQNRRVYLYNLAAMIYFWDHKHATGHELQLIRPHHSEKIKVMRRRRSAVLESYTLNGFMACCVYSCRGEGQQSCPQIAMLINVFLAG